RDHLHVLGGHAEVDEERLDALPAAIGEQDVVLLGAARIGVGLEVHQPTLLGDAGGRRLELLFGLGGQLGAVEPAEHGLQLAQHLAVAAVVAGEDAHAAVADLIDRAVVVDGARAGRAGDPVRAQPGAEIAAADRAVHVAGTEVTDAG